MKIFRYGQDRLTGRIALQIARGEMEGHITRERRTLLEERHRDILEVSSGAQAVYGINTGFGPLCNTKIEAQDTVLLQENLLRSHAVGVGEWIEPEIAKLMLILKVHALSQGHSGISTAILDRILWHIDKDVIPCVPSQGSLGASGDLAPLAHLFLPLIGEGKVWTRRGQYSTMEILGGYDLRPLELHPKAGLALINGTQFMLAHAIVGLEKMQSLLDHADIAAALTADGLFCSRGPYDPRLHEVRPHPGCQFVADRLWHLLEGSGILYSHRDCDRVQDPYSVRCVPQVHGSSRQAWLHLKQTLEIEMNAVTDNPVWVQGGGFLSGGHFHGQPLAIPIDYAAIATAEIGSISERRTYFAIDGKRPPIPKLLLSDIGVNSGFMIVQYTAAALVSENKTLCFPASADSIPSSLGQEDHVSMGAHGARKFLKICQNVQSILTCELLCAAQAVDFHQPTKTSHILQQVHQAIRQRVQFADQDRLFGQDIQSLQELIQLDLLPQLIDPMDSDLEDSLRAPFLNF